MATRLSISVLIKLEARVGAIPMSG
jgi:hypothetical protein